MASELFRKVTLPAYGSGLAYTLYLYLNLLKYYTFLLYIHPRIFSLSIPR